MVPRLPGWARRGVRLTRVEQAERCGPTRWKRTGPEAHLTYAVDRAAGFVLALAVRQDGIEPVLRIVVEDSSGGRTPIGTDPSIASTLVGIVLGSAGPEGLRIHLSSSADVLSVRAWLCPSGAAFAASAARFGGSPGAGSRWQLRGLPGFDGLPPARRWWRPAGIGDVLARAADLGACCEARRPAVPDSTPLVSFVVPTCETPPSYLADLLAAFRQQRPGTAQLILSDDGSTRRQTLAWLDRHEHVAGVTVLRHARRRGIAVATNAGIDVASGTFVGLVDHDDTLAPFTTDVLADALEKRPASRFLYTDEVVTDARLRPKGLMLKPAFDPVLLSGVNYVNHL